MNISSKIFLLVSSLIASACTQLGFVVVNAPAHFSNAITVSKNIAYGDLALQTLDVYQPKAQVDKALPVILFLHGGRWTDGNKGQYAFVGKRLAESGYVTVVADYRKYPQVKFPTFVEDSAKAFAWVNRNIARYGGDGENIVIMGHSSGAHMGALLAADERYLEAENIDPKAIRAFVGLAGPYHFEPKEPDLMDMFGPPSNYPQMQVSTFIDGNEPPMYLLWGAQDTLVYKINIDRLKSAIDEKGGAVEVQIYDDLDHTDVVKAFTWVYKSEFDVVGDVLGFIKGVTTEAKEDIRD